MRTCLTLLSTTFNTKLKLPTRWDKPDGRKLMLKSKHTTPIHRPLLSAVTTICLTTPSQCSRTWRVIPVLLQLKTTLTTRLLATQQPLKRSIGYQEVKLPQSKTRANAVPAGLSPLPELSLPPELSSMIPPQLITLSNKSSIAIKPETVAPVVSWTWLSPTLKPIHLSFPLTIHTQLPMDLAHTTLLKELVPSLPTKTFKLRRILRERWAFIQWKPPFLSVQSLSVLPPAQLLSKITNQVSFLRVAVLKLITVFLPSVGVNLHPTVTSTSSSRTNGVHLGDKMVSSWSISTTLVKSLPMLLIQSYECDPSI